MKTVLVRPPLPPTSLVLLSVLSTQVGSALAKSLFVALGPVGAACLRVCLAAIILWLFRRPPWLSLTGKAVGAVGALGLSLALMNVCFYLAIDRIPLGIAVALEFLGPLTLAVWACRRWIELLWVALAVVGIGLLTPIGSFQLDWLGVWAALLAAAGWASYILATRAAGRVLPGIEGLTWAMVVATGLLAPVGMGAAGRALGDGRIIAIAILVAFLSSAIPYALELIALRRVSLTAFGVLLSVEPMIATLAGWLILKETISPRGLIAIVLISVAAAAAAYYQQPRAQPPVDLTAP